MPKLLKDKKPSVLLTVSGMLEAMFPAKNRPGCVLELRNGRDTGLYYVPLSPHDCRARFPEKTRISFRVWASAVPDRDTGIIDTAGGTDRLWDVVAASRPIPETKRAWPWKGATT